jgi:hypothetical protein
LLASFVSEFAENPFPTLAKIIALKLAADIAGAGIGAAAKAALTAALSSLPSVAMPGGPGAGMAAVGVGSKVAAVGMIGAAGFGAYQVGTSFIDDAAASQNRRNKALAESSLAGDLALTPGAGREEKEAALARQKKSLTELETGPSAFDAFFGGLASDLSGLGIIDQDIEHPGKAHARKVEETRQNIAALESSIRDKVSAELEAGAKRAADVFVQRVSEAQPPGPNRSNAPTQPTVM